MPGNATVHLARRAEAHWEVSSRLSFNPDARGLTPAQTEALKIRDGYCCQTPDCPELASGPTKQAALEAVEQIETGFSLLHWGQGLSMIEAGRAALWG